MKITLAFAAHQARPALQLEARNEKNRDEKNDNGSESLVCLVRALNFGR